MPRSGSRVTPRPPPAPTWEERRCPRPARIRSFRAARVRSASVFFEFYRAARVRSASGPRSLPFSPTGRVGGRRQSVAGAAGARAGLRSPSPPSPPEEPRGRLEGARGGRVARTPVGGRVKSAEKRNVNSTVYWGAGDPHRRLYRGPTRAPPGPHRSPTNPPPGPHQGPTRAPPGPHQGPHQGPPPPTGALPGPPPSPHQGPTMPHHAFLSQILKKLQQTTDFAACWLGLGCAGPPQGCQTGQFFVQTWTPTCWRKPHDFRVSSGRIPLFPGAFGAGCSSSVYLASHSRPQAVCFLPLGAAQESRMQYQTYFASCWPPDLPELLARRVGGGVQRPPPRLVLLLWVRRNVRGGGTESCRPLGGGCPESDSQSDSDSDPDLAESSQSDSDPL
eukprot:gene22810-biopygen11772